MTDLTSQSLIADERFVTVPADLHFEERVERGQYGWRHSGVTEERFPVTRDQCGEQAQKLFHFARGISSEEAIRLIREEGFEPGRIGDILVFGENVPEAQRRHPVVGLGSVAEVDSKLSVPALWFDGERRTLDAIWYDGDWHRNYRFLGVRRHVGGLEKAVKRIASAPDRINSGFLELIGDSVEVSAIRRFVARDKFVIDRAGELPITYVGEAFTENFLGLVEEGLKTSQLRQRRLLESSVDGPIFSALGGETEAKIPLAHVFEFLKTADRSRWFFFYVADVSGNLWAIDTYWRARGWDLEAYSVTYPRGWRAGGHVVSR
jgi:hypothetical protein